jgi:hypothetical protein
MKKRDPLDRLSTSLKGWVLQGREAWRLFKAACRKLGQAGDLVGEAIILGLLAGQTAVDLARKPLGLAGVTAVVGTSSPITNGYGNEWLAASPWRMWIPVVVLPIGVMSCWVLSKSLVMLNREGEREAQRRQRERSHPGLNAQLAQHGRRREELNELLLYRPGLPPLEEADFCADIMIDTSRRIRARFGNRDVALVLLRHTEETGFSVVEGKGMLDREVRIRLELGEVEGDLDKTVEQRLEGLQYRHKLISFETGERRYLLIAVSGATIADDVLAEISESTVLMLEEYVWALRDQETEGREA